MCINNTLTLSDYHRKKSLLRKDTDYLQITSVPAFKKTICTDKACNVRISSSIYIFLMLNWQIVAITDDVSFDYHTKNRNKKALTLGHRLKRNRLVMFFFPTE